MKAKNLALTGIMLSCALVAAAQNIPTHEKYVKYFDDDAAAFSSYFPTWEPGQTLSEDENFFISRVRMKDRFVNTATQVDPEMTQDRKFSLCTPMGISDTYWQQLPRYVADGDNFSMWSYLDSYCGWSLSWIRVPGAFGDVAHKNGVPNGCTLFIDSWGSDNTEAGKIFSMLATKGSNELGGQYANSVKLLKFMKYYGVDGLCVNPEATVSHADDIQNFFAECFELAPKLDWHFHVYWYGTSGNDGYMDLGSTLNSGKSDWFMKDGKQVIDVYFLNYNWAGSLGTSVSTAKSVGGDSYDVYAGFDIQGNWVKGAGVGYWQDLANYPVSIIFWGNHTTDMIYQNATEDGSSDVAVQGCYLRKQEQVFSGGNRNPALTPDYHSIASSADAAMKDFHGIAKLLPARSTMNDLPFVTYFNLGSGTCFRQDGEVTFNQKWYNVGVQDYMPTWRWWITDADDKPIIMGEGAINCGFTFDDSWFAGTSMKFYGETALSNVRLFKTDFDVTANDEVTFVYKINNGVKSHMKLFWSFVGSEDEFHYMDVADATAAGQWNKVTAKASDLGMDGNVALLGLTFEDTDANYEALVGELAIVPQSSYSPVAPTITKAELLKRTYNGLDFKLIWECGELSAEKIAASEPIYNDEVDTWYFELWSQAEGDEPEFCGITSSWAHYVVGAPADPEVSKYRVGVCAVAPDGVTKSEIVWSDYAEIDATMVDGIQSDKAVIKAGEEFTISFIDPLHEEANLWYITNSVTGEAVSRGQMGGTSYTLSIDEEGYYDVQLTTLDNEEINYRGFIQISSDAVGALPIIEDFTANPTSINPSESTTLTYTAERLGEGTVSRGLQIQDPYMLMLPEDVLPINQKQYSIALWVKPTSFAHSKFGTNLINKRYTGIGWPNNNWGQFWVIIWPETENSAGRKILDDNIVSYSLYNPSVPSYNNTFNGNGNRHEVPNLQCCTDGNLFDRESYGLGVNLWSHIVITYDGRSQKIYFNGQLTGDFAETSPTYVAECPIYIGGSNVYHAGLNGVVDDVQVWHKALSDDEVIEAMAGYDGKEIPSELMGYWTFENYDAQSMTFANLGHGGTGDGWAARIIEQLGGAGENTSAVEDITTTGNNGVTGNPALPGTLDIVTTATFTSPGATSMVNTEAGTVGTFDTAGNYDVTLTLSNMWGNDVMTKAEYIIVGQSGIDGNAVAQMGVYPNPFTDAVNVVFAEAGEYTVNVYTVDGSLRDSQSISAIANEVRRVEVDGQAGMYLVQICKDGKPVNTVKVNKL